MSKSVKFRRESPSGGSHYDHQRSDSGVGSFSSDNESRTARPDRYSGSDFDSPFTSITLLNDLQEARDERDRYKKKCHETEKQNEQLRKELAEATAQRKAFSDRVDLLESERDSLTKQVKSLSEEVAELREETGSKDGKRSSRRKSNSPPTMSGALPADAYDDKKPRRSSSKKRVERAEREKEKERLEREFERDQERQKEIEKEKERETERLRRRFESSRGEDSDAKSSSTSSKTHRSRRDSYIEPLGHGAPRPQAQVPPSPSRPFAYTNPSYNSQQYPTMRESARPSVVVYGDTVEDEDGGYYPYPLASHKSRGRGER